MVKVVTKTKKMICVSQWNSPLAVLNNGGKIDGGVANGGAKKGPRRREVSKRIWRDEAKRQRRNGSDNETSGLPRSRQHEMPDESSNSSMKQQKQGA